MLTGVVKRATETRACIPAASTNTKSDNNALQPQVHKLYDTR
jgi:hypothetical protein